MNVNNLIEALEKWDGDMPVVVQSALKKEEAFPLQSVEWADRDAGPAIVLTGNEPGQVDLPAITDWELENLRAALRYFQSGMTDVDRSQYLERFGKFGPLNDAEIEALCTRLVRPSLIQETPNLREFVAMIGRMTTREEDDSIPEEDSLGTLDELIVTARKLGAA